ncbi:hypothetical protein HK105_205573 [Polyrhizophydium stewartii]|uniref:BZIP domain-containing protein n=1 Tax=Polyrhizophydium stewartii TaxID=2732419 RepID=A0ABR4N5K9_9FUNG
MSQHPLPPLSALLRASDGAVAAHQQPVQAAPRQPRALRPLAPASALPGTHTHTHPLVQAIAAVPAISPPASGSSADAGIKRRRSADEDSDTSVHGSHGSHGGRGGRGGRGSDRQQRNRIAAQAYRMRKRAVTDDLRDENLSLRARNEELTHRIGSIERSNEALAQRVEALSAQLSSMVAQTVHSRPAAAVAAAATAPAPQLVLGPGHAGVQLNPVFAALAMQLQLQQMQSQAQPQTPLPLPHAYACPHAQSDLALGAGSPGSVCSGGSAASGSSAGSVSVSDGSNADAFASYSAEELLAIPIHDLGL